MSSDASDVDVSPLINTLGWQKVFSKSHKAYYWFNTIDGSKSWTEPTIPTQVSTNVGTDFLNHGKRKPATEIFDAEVRSDKKATRASEEPFIAVIVSDEYYRLRIIPEYHVRICLGSIS